MVFIESKILCLYYNRTTVLKERVGCDYKSLDIIVQYKYRYNQVFETTGEELIDAILLDYIT